MLYAGNILDKAREVFAAAIKHRPRIRLTIRQRGQVLELPMSTREQRRLTHPTKKASSDTEEKAFSFLSIKLGDALRPQGHAEADPPLFPVLPDTRAVGAR